MKLSELLEIKKEDYFPQKHLNSDLIALDGKDGKVLFDTRRNKKEHIEQYMSGDVLSLWTDMVIYKSVFGDYCKAIMKCYISHDSWLRDTKEGE